ncbi:DNA-binding protein [Gordonia sp. HS-NH1]|uniref:DNA-binding protein n=1 Tax=Gordonia sp. HS-NH1 TaxID=1435068 RepID=UPI0009FE9F4E|nr:DNA-binding protein [Gordonia sp. HS-NH1]
MTNEQLFRPPEPDRERAQREYIGLFHIAERHGGTPERRARQAHPDMLEPYGAAKIVAGLAGGGFVPHPDEDPVDDTDIMAALTLMPKLRLEIDELETMLLLAARRSGITWQHIAYGLGLGSAQAARQRYDRLVQRTSDTDGDDDDKSAESGSSTDA